VRVSILGILAILAVVSTAGAAATAWIEERPIVEKALTLIANGQSVPAVLSAPEKGSPVWGVVLVPGSFANDVDGNYAPGPGSPFAAKPHVYKDLARQLAARGVAVLRYARAGATTIDAAESAAHRRFADRTNVVAAAIRALRDAVPGLGGVALAGHSEGGPVSLLGLTGSPALKAEAYISLSAPARRMFDIMLQQTESSTKDGWVTFGPSRFRRSDYELSFEFIRRGEPVPEDLKKTLPPFGVHSMDAASQAYLRDYDRLESVKMIAALPLPVLVVQGELDTSVLPDNADLLMAARKGNSAPTEKAFFPGLTHFYKKSPPGMDPAQAFLLETDCDPGVAAAIAAWLGKIERRPGR
jgi:alpha-beta hydrolase superfamily lysophospholipase